MSREFVKIDPGFCWADWSRVTWPLLTLFIRVNNSPKYGTKHTNRGEWEEIEWEERSRTKTVWQHLSATQPSSAWRVQSSARTQSHSNVNLNSILKHTVMWLEQEGDLKLMKIRKFLHPPFNLPPWHPMQFAASTLTSTFLTGDPSTKIIQTREQSNSEIYNFFQQV